MSGASARYSCLRTPVETVTPPWGGPHGAARRGKRKLYAESVDHALTGSGYSTPKVSTVTFFMTCGVLGLSL